jgi:putative tryptophan/tyrosine transport system substrate-binding protein
MRRREFIAGMGGAAAWPLMARAQQQTKPIIGWLDTQLREPMRENVDEFRQGLAEIGISEGRDITLEYYTSEGVSERLSVLAADLVKRRPAVIVAATGGSALAAKEATGTIPIIFVAGSDPVEMGLVASLNRPGGNLTGVSAQVAEIAAKRLDLLHQAVPAADSVALLVGGAINSPYSIAETKVTEFAARSLGLRLLALNAITDSEIAAAFATMVEHRIGAVLCAGVLVRGRSAQIISLADRFAIATMFYNRRQVREGALLSYGPDPIQMFRQLGAYTGRILKGEKPADLPVVQPTKFEMAINLRTAKLLGLNIPETLLVLADEVIE